MRIILDTTKKLIIVPDNFYEKMAELNTLRVENGVPEIAPLLYIRESFEKAMNDAEKSVKRKYEVTVKREPKE
jgi:hypothetical protein